MFICRGNNNATVAALHRCEIVEKEYGMIDK